MPSYELLYFPARGRAEQVRLLFTLAGVPYEEKAPEDWMALKPETPFGRMPVLTVRSDAGEVKLPESGAIMRLLARRHDLYGSGDIEHAMCDAIADYVADERTKYIDIAYAATLGTTEEQIASYWKQLPQTLRDLTRALARSTKPDSGWFITDKPTFADVAAFDLLDGIENLKPGVLADHSELTAFMARVRALPQLQTFLAERSRP